MQARIELLKAVGNGDLEVLKKYVEATKADVNWLEKDEDGKEQTPLMMASRKGKLELAQYLVERGAELDKANERGVTAVYRAAQEGHLAMLQFLLQQGADKDKVTDDGCSPLFIAAQQGHLEVLQ